ncbi:MAG: hypothetical protein GWP05_07600 [Anaerolineaceae bacterium]|nr:hypothetical protein [Anaerolineaceae bacterium]
MNARQLALSALRQAHQDGTYVQDRLHDLMSEHELSAADRSLATEIALATVRHRRTVDLLLDSLLARPIRKTDPVTRLVLESAAYQIVFLDRVPDYAVVNEAVQLVRWAGSPRMAGLVNAVLRRLTSLIDRDAKAARAGDPRRIVPLPHGGRVVLKQPLLRADQVGRLADAYSFPDALVKRWCGRWGAGNTERVLAALNRPPRVFARVNTLRTSPGDLLASLAEAERETVLQVTGNVLDLTGLPHAALLDLLERGLVTVEDPTAMLAVEALEVQPGETVLDLCAAPGGKTSYLAELMQGRGLIVALDREGPRLDLLRRTCERLRLNNVRLLANAPAAFPDDLPGEFDRVLIDVPCSNTGVLNRRAEARWRLKDNENENDKSIRSLNRLQLSLLAQGARATRSDGLCVYSTCSLEPEENGRLVRRFLQDNPWMVLQSELQTLPSESGDGGYFARLKRIEDGPGSL